MSGGGGRCSVISLLQRELLSQLGGDLVGEFLRVPRMLGRGHHRRAPAEDRVSTNRHEYAANQQFLKNHIFEFGVGFWFFFHRIPPDPVLSPVSY